jgi:hypothetical protein
MFNPALKCIIFMRSLLLWDVWQRSLETNYHSPQLIIAEQRRCHLRHGGSLK